MNNTDYILSKIKRDCYNPVSFDWHKTLNTLKDTILLDNNSQSLLINLINAHPPAHETWFNFYFNNYSFDSLAKINSHKSETKLITKVVNLLVAKKDLPLLKQYWAWLGQANKTDLALNHIYGHDKNILHVCIDTGFSEGLAFFHQLLPKGLERHVKTSLDNIPLSSLDLALSRSGFSNHKVISYILQNTDFNAEIKSILEFANKSNHMDKIRMEQLFFVNGLENIEKAHILHSIISRLRINYNYFVSYDIFNSFLSNPSLERADKQLILSSYKAMIEKDLFAAPPHDKEFVPAISPYLKQSVFSSWAAPDNLQVLSTIIELTPFSKDEIKTLSTNMQKTNTNFSNLDIEEKQNFISFFEKYCLSQEIQALSVIPEELEKSKNKL